MAGKRFGLRSTFSQAVGGEVFQGRDEFEGGLLPTEQEVIEMMVWIIAPRQGRMQLSMVESAKIVSQTLSEHWIWSNVYPKMSKIRLKSSFRSLKSSRPLPR